MTENWRAVPGWDGYYEVSSSGQVRSMPRAVPGRPGVTIPLKGRTLRAWVKRDGHLLVALCRDNRRVVRHPHRLVLEAFVGPCPEGMEACHGNGDPADNRLENLRWDTRSANTYDKVRHGTHPSARRTECVNGHPFDEQNTYRDGGGRRHCRICRTAAKRAYNQRKKETA